MLSGKCAQQTMPELDNFLGLAFFFANNATFNGRFAAVSICTFSLRKWCAHRVVSVKILKRLPTALAVALESTQYHKEKLPLQCCKICKASLSMGWGKIESLALTNYFCIKLCLDHGHAWPYLYVAWAAGWDLWPFKCYMSIFSLCKPRRLMAITPLSPCPYHWLSALIWNLFRTKCGDGRA